eukprot:1189684-Prorocentrum_minimum.AAC.2
MANRTAQLHRRASTNARRQCMCDVTPAACALTQPHNVQCRVVVRMCVPNVMLSSGVRWKSGNVTRLFDLRSIKFWSCLLQSAARRLRKTARRAVEEQSRSGQSERRNRLRKTHRPHPEGTQRGTDPQISWK